MSKRPKEPLKLWRAEGDSARPVLVDCPDGGYPASDAEGHAIYVNSHFATEAEAWQHILDNAEAWVSNAGSDISNAKFLLLKSQTEAGNAAEHFKTVRDNFRDWEREQERIA